MQGCNIIAATHLTQLVLAHLLLNCCEYWFNYLLVLDKAGINGRGYRKTMKMAQELKGCSLAAMHRGIALVKEHRKVNAKK